MSRVVIYAEGGGTTDSRARLRMSMAQFLVSGDGRGLRGRTLQVIMCGSRQEAYERFTSDLRRGHSDNPLLLVDAEAPVQGTARQHLQVQDGWDLALASDDQIHLMTEMMESWFLPDPDALERFYGQGFRASALPARQNVEEVPKADVANGLAKATRDTKAGEYHKLRHGPRILESLNSDRVRARAPRCERLFATLQTLSR